MSSLGNKYSCLAQKTENSEFMHDDMMIKEEMMNLLEYIVQILFKFVILNPCEGIFII
jgi:hypothetical protein